MKAIIKALELRIRTEVFPVSQMKDIARSVKGRLLE